MAAFQPEDFGGAADISMVLVQLLKNVVAFIGRARLMKGEEVTAAAVSVAINQRRQVLAIKADGRRVHNDDALDHITKFADISRPRVAHEAFYSVTSNFTS